MPLAERKRASETQDKERSIFPQRLCVSVVYACNTVCINLADVIQVPGGSDLGDSDAGSRKTTVSAAPTTLSAADEALLGTFMEVLSEGELILLLTGCCCHCCLHINKSF